MKISKVKVENYRLLKDFSIDLQEELSLVIGKNNTGKTSLLSVLDKFLNEKGRFSYDDFNIEFKSEFEKSVDSTDEPEDFVSKGIKLQLFIEYNENDDLSNISSVLMDLDPDKNIIVLGFEYTVTHADFMILKKDYSDFKAHEISKKEVRSDYQPRECKDFIKTRLDNYFKNQKKSYDYEVTTSDNIENSECESNVSQVIAVKDIKVNDSSILISLKKILVSETSLALNISVQEGMLPIKLKGTLCPNRHLICIRNKKIIAISLKKTKSSLIICQKLTIG